MTEPIVRTKLKAAQLEAVIMERLGGKPDCAGIIQVYVRATGVEPPEETWTHTLVSRRPTIHRSAKETAAMHAVLNEMRKEFDLLPDYKNRRSSREHIAVQQCSPEARM